MAVLRSEVKTIDSQESALSSIAIALNELVVIKWVLVGKRIGGADVPTGENWYFELLIRAININNKIELSEAKLIHSSTAKIHTYIDIKNENLLLKVSGNFNQVINWHSTATIDRY